MKVGILTFPNSISYGAVLQMYALYHKVNDLGCDVEIINYHNAYMKAELHCVKKGEKKTFISMQRKRIRNLIHFSMYARYRRFEKKKINCYPVNPFNKAEKLKKIRNRYDVVICGSDQVWNPDITDYDTSYFLDFCGENTKRVSYAPSFGVETISEEFSNKIKKELMKFSNISVREAQGQNILEPMLDKQIPLVVDPTLLMTSEEWKLEESEFSVKEDYILYYTIKHSDKLFKFTLELAKKTGLKIMIVGGNFINKLRNNNPVISYANDIGPSQWLYLVSNAKYVVTNSFHGTAFSINYRKDFYVEYSSFTNSRLEHIINTLGLEKQIVKDINIEEVVPTDYSKTDKVLPVIREQSLEYLKKALSVE